MRTMADRIRSRGDLWSGMSSRRESLREPVERLKSL
jgi:hypothetical protein